jgi:hypothetical protein
MDFKFPLSVLNFGPLDIGTTCPINLTPTSFFPLEVSKRMKGNEGEIFAWWQNGSAKL